MFYKSRCAAIPDSSSTAVPYCKPFHVEGIVCVATLVPTSYAL